ncbi:MAG: hypothetical protein ABI837_20480 [Acidobacteriota bacterium]
MQVSAEIRWFWSGDAPGVAQWFRSTALHALAAGGGGERTDEYLADPSQNELGIKLRGGKKGVEVKGLVARLPIALAEGPFGGPIELWTKWTSPALELKPEVRIAVVKERYLRKFDGALATPQEIALGGNEKPIGAVTLPDRGCNVEFTSVRVGSGPTWSTLGFEAFGTLDTVESDLRRVAALLATRQPPSLAGATLASYPTWLQKPGG